MEESQIIALDLGERRTGIAVSDPSYTLSFPVTHIEAKNNKEWVSKLREVLKPYSIYFFVVGIPYNQFGEESATAKKFSHRITLLRDEFQKPVIKWDESYTTACAEAVLIQADMSRKKRKQVIDKLAATVLLQNYLDNKSNLNADTIDLIQGKISR